MKQPELEVWYGAMPESNGKSNFTAILKRKGCGITLDRSEYPDRVRYEADRARYLIGDLDEEPCILDYDADKHSGYDPIKHIGHLHLPPYRSDDDSVTPEDFVDKYDWAEEKQNDQRKTKQLLDVV